ncbi:MAG: hypothetical protein IT406_03325 [Candidatus Yanofskybacteria bacterium]|nr:hypothetical protein [Candidatus Yanofskybacteria bacterium]
MYTVLFLAGMLVGGLLVRWAMLGGLWRGAHEVERERAHHAVARIARAHFRSNGTLHAAQLARMLESDAAVAEEHLERMARGGMLARHTRASLTFYTLR